MIKKMLLRAGRDAIIGCLALCAYLKKKIAKTGRTRVLVVRLDAIGDFVLWLEAAKELRELYPRDRYEITLLGNRACTQFAESCASFDKVLPFDRNLFNKSGLHRLRVVSMLRMSLFDVAIQPTFSRDYAGDAIIKYCGAREKIGSMGDTSCIDADQKRMNDRHYTRLVPADGRPMMELERNAEFVRGLGRKAFPAGVSELPVRAALPANLRAKNYYVIFPGTLHLVKRWPLANFAELAHRVYRETGWEGVICGGKDEVRLGETLAREAGALLRDLTGRTSLDELASIIKGGRILLSNDTSAVHMAAALGVPSVCILGGGHYGRFLPYPPELGGGRPLPTPVNLKRDCFGCNWKCIHKTPEGEPVPCITGVTVDMAWEATLRILKGGADGR